MFICDLWRHSTAAFWPELFLWSFCGESCDATVQQTDAREKRGIFMLKSCRINIIFWKEQRI